MPKVKKNRNRYDKFKHLSSSSAEKFKDGMGEEMGGAA
jgi:hypothetical protein